VELVTIMAGIILGRDNVSSVLRGEALRTLYFVISLMLVFHDVLLLYLISSGMVFVHLTKTKAGIHTVRWEHLFCGTFHFYPDDNEDNDIIRRDIHLRVEYETLRSGT